MISQQMEILLHQAMRLVFTNGSTASKTISIRIYDDAEVEAAQTFTLTYSISGTTNAQAGSSNQTYTFTINDNDSAPTAAYKCKLYSSYL